MPQVFPTHFKEISMHTKSDRTRIMWILAILLILCGVLPPQVAKAAELCPPLQAEGPTYMQLAVQNIRTADSQSFISNDGARVEAYTPTGKLAGCSAVDQPGLVSDLKLYGGQNGFAEGDVISLKLFDKDGVELSIAFNPIDIKWVGDNGASNTAFQIKVVDKPTTTFTVCAFVDSNFDRVQSDNEPCVAWNSSNFGTVFAFTDSTGYVWSVIEADNAEPFTVSAISVIGDVSLFVLSLNNDGVPFQNTYKTTLTEASASEVIQIPLYPPGFTFLFLPAVNH
jgi:hypothetical protein